ncbi:hypothetical protein D3C76_341960 [compost metagenome]
MPTPANKWLWIPLLPLMLLVLLLQLIALWHIIVLPSATVHYSKDGMEELRIIWNVQHRIYKGRLSPGSSTRDYGFLFSDEQFFMEIEWWNKNACAHCVNIIPTWSNTRIYIDANGDIDHSEGSGTDSDRLTPCAGNYAWP